MTKANGTNGTTAPIDGRLATAPNAPEDLPRLLDELSSLREAYENDQPGARLQLVNTAQSLLQAMETPQETMLRYIWAQPAAFAAIETCVNLGIFRILSHDERPKSVSELADATGAKPELLGRILKHLGAMGVIVETDADEYQRNRLAMALAMPRYGEPFPAITGCTIPAVHAIPVWLKENKYSNPTDPMNSPFTMGFSTDMHFFEWLNSNPRYPDLANQFNILMSAYHQGRPSWMDEDFYPVCEQLIQGSKNGADDVLIVDVGGNKGHDLEEFRAKWPDASGRLILQDLPHVLDEIKTLDPAIEPMAHDFFTEQPVKGARAYFLHSILHDWNEERCQSILRNLAGAMTPGYSKLLINENVIPNKGAHWQTTALDIVMMADFASQERTESQWSELIESAGFRIVKIWNVQASAESLIECELAE